MSNIKVSIIVPAYNVERYICECMDSLVNQTLKDIEIIVVDDGSTDETSHILDGYANKSKAIFVIHQKNAGLSNARNVGVRNSHGEYLLFVDSDDYIKKEACEVLYTNAKEAKADVVCGSLIGNGVIHFDGIPSASKGIECMAQAINEGKYVIISVLKLVNKDFFTKKNLFFPEGLVYEDHLYTLKLYSEASSVIELDYEFYYYRVNREGSITQLKCIKQAYDIIRIIEIMINYIDSLKYNNEFTKIFAKILANSFYHLSDVWIRLNKNDQKVIIDIVSDDIKKRCTQGKLKSSRMNIQNTLFAKYPRFLNHIIGSNGIFRPFMNH